MYPGFEESEVATPIFLCGRTCPDFQLARSAVYSDVKIDDNRVYSGYGDIMLTIVSDL